MYNNLLQLYAFERMFGNAYQLVCNNKLRYLKCIEVVVVC